jgi:LysM repeat protein
MSTRLFIGYSVLGLVALVLVVLAVLAIRVVSLDTPETAAPEANRSSYVVEKGDSLSVISQKTGVPVEQIEKLNPTLDPLALVPGRRLELKPASARAKRRRARRRGPPPRVYVVKPGDGLLGIAGKTDVPQERLRSLNPNHDLEKLTPGMRLKLRR